ncbi:MAG: LamG-like jellyroll fold domain-containing protein [Planctomycetota bacterium]|jgi:hypothetical protein
MTRKKIVLFIIMICSSISQAKVDLVTLPSRDTVQLTIYNSADMTLVRESRALTLKEGKNSLQFSWANTLIDPTSLEMLPKAGADKIDIADLTYPPRVKNLGLWNIQSGLSGKTPVEITYLTSGLSWRAFYMGTLTEDEKTMRLQGYVRVTNNSGEDYENAQTRLIVGKVHILDRIADLARRQYPYGRPGEVVPRLAGAPVFMDELRVRGRKAVMKEMSELARKEIKKEGLSEYFLYTIEGTETIPTGWSKRLISFDVDDVPVINLYKYERERYGNSVVRFLSFKNDEEHKLGDTPIPGGRLKVYRNVEDKGHLSYTGQSSFKYIPVDEDVELNLGLVADVVVEPKLMDFKTDSYRFDNNGNISGWDEIRKFKIEVRNTRDIPVKIEIQRNFNTGYWKLKKGGDFDDFSKVDMDTVKFTLKLKPQTKKQFRYTLTTYHGIRQEKRTQGIETPVSRNVQQSDDLHSYLVSWWKFDEGIGNTAYDSAGDNHGSIHGAKWTSGRIGGALIFDGVDDYVNCGNDSVFNITGPVTLSAWIKTSSPGKAMWQGIVTKGEILWKIQKQLDGRGYFECWGLKGAPSPGPYLQTVGVNMNDGQWHHIVGTYDKATMRIYWDGAENNSFSVSGNIDTGGYPVYIGGVYGKPEYVFGGLIDDVRIYKRALSANEIKRIYQNGLKGS